MNVRELPPHTMTRLVMLANDVRKPVNQRTTDATTAITRGVAEYVSGLQLNGQPAFAKCFDAWAEPVDTADYPAFVAHTNDNTGKYDDSNLNPGATVKPFGDGTAEVKSGELTVEVKCEIWTTDPGSRTQLCLLLEEAFAPVEWMHGFRLELPHYFNQRAEFQPGDITYLGGATEAMAGFVNARINLMATLPRVRSLPIPVGQIDTRVIVQTNNLPITPPPKPLIKR